MLLIIHTLDFHPRSHLFITQDGKLSREKCHAATKDSLFVQILTVRRKWDDFALKMWTQGIQSENLYKEVSSTASAPFVSEEFDSLLWVKGAVMSDVKKQEWNQMTKAVNEKDVFKEKVTKSGRFSFKTANQDPSAYINENTAGNTTKSNRTIVNLLSLFFSEFHPEETIETVPIEKLPQILCSFFQSIAKEGGESLGAGSLQTYLNALRRILVEKRAIDISKDPSFGQVFKVVQLKQRESCINGETVGKHSSDPIPEEVLWESWKQGLLGNRDPHALIAAVKLHLQTGFGCRSQMEMYQILNGDILEGPERADGLPSYLKFSERCTKTRSGKKGQGSKEIKMIFPADEFPQFCGVRLYKEYKSRCPPKVRDDPKVHLFLSVKTLTPESWKNVDVWYASLNMGKDKLGDIFKTIVFLKALFIKENFSGSLIVSQLLKLTNVDLSGIKLTETSIR